MKKILFVMIMVFSVTMVLAQKNVRQTASNQLKDGKLDKALESIKQCLQDPSTAQDAKAWFISGNIYLDIANTKDEKYKNLDPDPIQKALEAYQKAIELDPKKEFYDDIFAKLNWQRNNFFNAAADCYNKKAYKDAMLNFEKAASTLAITKVADTLSLFYAAACASLAGEKAKSKQYYIELLNGGAKSVAIYASLADAYRLDHDSVNALKIIREGRKAHPGNLQLTLAEANVYIFFNDVPKALPILNLAAQKDSSNYLVFNALGSDYQKIYEDTTKPQADRLDAFKRSEAAYKTTIRIKPDYYDVYVNFASLYFNSAVPIAIRANELPLDQKEQYDKLTAQANSFYALALPLLKKADEIQANDMNTLNSLRQIYQSTGDKENLKAIVDKIQQLRKK